MKTPNKSKNNLKIKQITKKKQCWLFCVLIAIALLVTIIMVIQSNHFFFSLQKPTDIINQADPSSDTMFKDALPLVEAIPEVTILQKVITDSGNKYFFDGGKITNDVISIDLRENNVYEHVSSRFETFNVDIKTKEITVYDVTNNIEIPLVEWKKRMIDTYYPWLLGSEQFAEFIVQDGSYYGPKFDPNLYQLEKAPSHHYFAKSDAVDLSKYLGEKVLLRYREVTGLVMGEQQFIIVYSIE